jgi:hypothetical protein
MAAEQLLPHADAQHGLRQAANDGVKAMCTQVAHGTGGFTLARENDTLSLPQLIGIVGQHSLNAQTMQSVHH